MQQYRIESSMPGRSVTEKREDNRYWKSDIIGGAVEEEGIFGFSFGLVAATTNATIAIASSVIAATLDVVSGTTYNAGRLLTGSPTFTELCITKHDNREVEDPILLKLTTSVPHVILNAVFPVLQSPSTILRLLTCKPNTLLALHQASSTDVTFNNVRSYESINSKRSSDHKDTSCSTENNIDDMKSALDVEPSFCTNRTSSLSTLSDTSGASTDDSEDDGYNECLKLMRQNDTKTNRSSSKNDASTEIKFDTAYDEEVASTDPESPKFYLDCTSLLKDETYNETLSNLQLVEAQNNATFFILQNAPQHIPQLESILDVLVQSALSLALDDSANSKKICPVWKPEGDTKKTLQRMCKWNADERAEALSKTVLKWMGVLKTKKEDLRMIKTRGIVNMSPIDLKDLLIDCSRVHLVNKNSLGKKDVCKYPFTVGTTTIVENTVKIPFVGGEIYSISLTHSRCVSRGPTIGDSYIVVSKSVQKILNEKTGLPYYSITLLRPVGDDTSKTDLVNIAQISEVPVPNFLVNKIAFTGAVDFFNNLRSI